MFPNFLTNHIVWHLQDHMNKEVFSSFKVKYSEKIVKITFVTTITCVTIIHIVKRGLKPLQTRAL